MSTFNDSFANKSTKIYILLLFLFASAIGIYLFPTQGKFKFEYQKGTPWQHEDLIAPFDFAIYKTDAEIKTERDSVLRNFKPYFKLNKSIAETEITNFTNVFELRYKDAIQVAKKIDPNFHTPDSLKEFSKSISLDLLSFIYEKGVVDFNEVLEKTKKGTSIVILNNNIAENRDVEEVFTQKIAYGFVNKRITSQFPNSKGFVALIENIKLYDFVSQNLKYDNETTQKVQQDLVNNIPTKKGMIQAGERIISRGDLVQDENFRVLESLRKDYENILGTSSQIQWLFLGQILVILMLFGVLYLFLYHFRPEILESFRKSLFIIMMVLIMMVSAALVVRFNNVSIYVIPFAALPIIIRAFYDSRLAFFIHLVTVMMIGFLAPNSFEFIFLQFVAGAVSIFTLTQLHRRGQLFLSVSLILLSYCVAYTAIAIMQEGEISKINYETFLWFAGNGLLLLTCYPLIFMFEKVFGFLSDVTLLELSDTNHPALRNLAEKAPGTFQHVIQVANLAEEAIRKIGGNALLMRVGALYHDIGKTGAPAFFIENQSGQNPHNKLSYEKSAEVIIQHVLHGVELAKKYKIPAPITDFILTHHGTGLVKYFYTKYANENEGKLPDISKFSYPGPAPFTKETAVLMMADAVEASSRTLKEYNENSIDTLVEKIINNQIEDSQFEEADITFKDIHMVKQVFKEKLMNIYHARIEYPEKKN
ncbi:MAG: HDIG domain-containing protein [Salinivirgaceae bacterium]|nr:HDIG domain-containing protein [Salinivirgaceae bacterium]